MLPATLIWSVGVMLCLNVFLRFNEQRQGAVLVDPVLDMLPAAELSAPIFALVYGTIVTTLVVQLRQPVMLLLTLQSYGLLMAFRMLLMYTIPLEPPPGMIMLVDPFVTLFGGGPNWGKDLFFSGHTSTTFLAFLCLPGTRVRWFILAACATVGTLITIQHAHYTIDVLIAPFVAYGSRRICLLLLPTLFGAEAATAAT